MIKVFVNGAFDVLHVGHINLLMYAKSLGTHLLVAIDSDERIVRLKGKDRPINNVKTRLAIMSQLKPVDDVNIFDTDQQLIDIIRDYSPDIMVKGSDWKDGTIIGEQYCKRVVFYERDSNSTTKTIEDFIARRQLL
jgi:D-beta-D-heptose 7-phosphate kinase/D-beta-D-heptose 1-phosphate adenosyltransferase